MRNDGRGGIEVSHSGEFAASAGAGGIRVWNLKKGNEIQHWPDECGFGPSLAFTPDDRTLLQRLYAAPDISVFNIETGKCERQLATQEGAAWTLDLRPNVQLMAASSVLRIQSTRYSKSIAKLIDAFELLRSCRTETSTAMSA